MLEIRKAVEADKTRIWEIIKAVIATGDTYVFAPDATEEEMIGYWCGPEKWTYVALADGEIVGSVFIVKQSDEVGFEIIGEIPDAFQHAENGLTNALIMYRKL